MAKTALRTQLPQQLHGKQILLRVDYNVPMKDGVPTSTWRIDCTIAWLRQLLDRGACVTVVSHLGRPQEDVFDATYSTQPLCAVLADRLGQPIVWCPQWPAQKPPLQPGQIALAENVRFLVGEQQACPVLAAKMADGYDMVIIDAFATAHRRHASNCAISAHCDAVYLGPLFQEELQAIRQRTAEPKRPSVAVVGGAKMATKIDLITQLLEAFDAVLLGGGLANTFLLAQGFAVGQSLVEPERVAQAKALLARSQQSGCATLMLPIDVVVEAPSGSVTTVPVDQVGEGRILDLGPATLTRYRNVILTAKTVLWNGPMGLFEQVDFAQGSLAMAQAVHDVHAEKLIGGGDTLAVIEQSGLSGDGFGHQSTGGGAFLAALVPGGLPVLEDEG